MEELKFLEEQHRRDRTQHHRPGPSHRGLLLPPVPAERARIQRKPERPHTPAPSKEHRPEHDLLRGDHADRGLAEQLPPQNVRLSVLRAAIRKSRIDFHRFSIGGRFQTIDGRLWACRICSDSSYSCNLYDCIYRFMP